MRRARARRAPRVGRSAWAAKPITGGPVRKPSEPMEETAAMASPDGVSVWRPAALKIRGTPLATPRPIGNRPASAAAGAPISSMAASGTPVSSAPSAAARRPDAVVDSVADEPAGGHAGGEECVGERGERGGRAEVLAQVQAAPAGHRTLGQHHQQAQHGEQHHAAAGGVKRGVSFALRQRSRAEPARGGDNERQQERRCAPPTRRGSKPSAASAAAKPAPSMPPNAQPACSEDRMGAEAAARRGRRGCSWRRPSWR